MTRVFISYRRDDTRDVVGRIYNRLCVSFGETNVFRDIESIPLGEDFEHRLQLALAKCDIGLVLIGPAWASASDEAGESRLFDPGDFLRLEVEYLLKRRIPIIPVLVKGATMPTAAGLPPTVAQITSMQGIALRPGERFDADVSELIRRLRARVRWRPSYPWVAAGSAGPIAGGVLALTTLLLSLAFFSDIPDQFRSLFTALGLGGDILGIGAIIVGLYTLPASYIFALRRSARLKQRLWFWGLLAALTSIFVFPIVAANTVGIGDPLVFSSSAPSWEGAKNLILDLSGLIFSAILAVAFGLFGPIDMRIARLRANGSVSQIR
jgi:hypothetical protein